MEINVTLLLLTLTVIDFLDVLPLFPVAVQLTVLLPDDNELVLVGLQLKLPPLIP